MTDTRIPFWNTQSKAISDILLGFTGINYSEYNKEEWDNSLTKLGLKSWYKVKVHKPSIVNGPVVNPEFHILNDVWQSVIDSENEKVYNTETVGKLLRGRKVRLYPNKEQEIMFNKMFGCSRYAYNKALNIRKTEYQKKLDDIREGREPDKPISDGDLKKLVANEESYPQGHFMLEVHSHVRSEACRDFFKACKSTMALLENGRIKKFEMKYRSKNARSQSILIEHANYTKRGVFYPRSFDNGKTPIKTYEPLPLPKDMKHDFRLVKTRTGRFYLCYSYDIDDPYGKNENDNQILLLNSERNTLRVISLDPGNRKFLCGYDSTGKVVLWGVHDQNKLIKMGRKYDKLQSIISGNRLNNHKKSKLRARMLRLAERIRNKVNELHCKAAKWLCDNYDVILLPDYPTQNMVRKHDGRRRINSTTARAMMTYSSYKFQQRLLQKVRTYKDKHVIMCKEDYTSQTCCRCGNRYKVSGSETYKCRNNQCNISIDRDINGAANIMIKHLTGLMPQDL